MKFYQINTTKAILITIILLLTQQCIQKQDSIETGTIQTDQYKLSYIIEGKGQPTIVIGSAKYYSRAFSQDLRKYIKFVFLDHRGFAPKPNKTDTTDYSLDKIILDIERARQQLKLGKIIIMGHSGHSYMALEYAKKYPENVTNVVMIGISPDLSIATEQLIEQNWQESVDPERKKILEENMHRLSDEKFAQLSPSQAYIQTYILNGPKAWYNAQFDASPLWEGIEMDIDMFDYMWGHVFRDIDITKGLDNFKKPIFLGLGRFDYLVGPPSTWNPIRSKFHDLTIRVFEKSGHTPQYEQPKLFDQELLDWLKLKKE
jgi:proline iminopeptidase